MLFWPTGSPTLSPQPFQRMRRVYVGVFTFTLNHTCAFASFVHNAEMQKTESGLIISFTSNAAPAQLPDWLPLALIGVVMLIVGVLAYVVLSRIFLRSSPAFQSGTISATEAQFRNVCAIMTDERREEIIRYYSQKHECDRQAAMRHAIDDRTKDANRW